MNRDLRLGLLAAIATMCREPSSYTAVPHAKWHPFHKLAMKNDPNWPIVTWVVARK